MRVVEQRFRHGRQGPSLRPFLVSAGVRNRGYSKLLERAITDFGADVAFDHIPNKVKEHYGIEVARNAAREITERQGARMLEQESVQTQIPDRPGVAGVVAELDGSMIPVVRTGSVTPRFGATLGGPEKAGAQWADGVIRCGAGQQTFIHCLGDGATWIAEQAEQRFGTQARYLIDFFHLSEYLSAAARVADQPQAWLEQQKQHLKQNRPDAVLDALAPHLERHKATADKPAPVKACYRYIHNRPGQFDYQSALAAGLPIGSGEVESAHRYVIQARLKLAGAWWKEDNAAKMLALRIVRANNEWEAYWQNSNQKAA